MTPDAAAALLLALAREELALVAADRWEELDELADRRAAALVALDALAGRPTPAHLHAILREAHATQTAVSEALLRARDAVAAELAGSDRRRSGAAAYRAATQL